MRSARDLTEAELLGYFHSLTDGVQFPQSIAGMAEGIGRGTQALGLIGFYSNYPDGQMECHMFGPGSVLYVAGPYLQDGPPDRESLCVPISCREFYDRMEAYWQRWYYRLIRIEGVVSGGSLRSPAVIGRCSG